MDAHKAITSDLARTPGSLLDRTGDRAIPVIVKYDYDPLATYTGTVRGLEATSPSVTGRSLSSTWHQKREYLGYLRTEERSISAAIEDRVPGFSVQQRYDVVYGGVAARVPADRIRDVLAVPGVVAVQPDELRQPQTDSSPAFIRATAAYARLRTTAKAGRGIIFGDLDTGLWPEHPSFADNGNLAAPPPKADGTPRTCDFGDNPLTPAVDPFQCTNKVISGQPFLQTYLSDPGRAAAEPFHTARDSNGHGSHTSSTAAGNIVPGPTYAGRQLANRIQGIAPGAWIAQYKVCGIQGCFSSDSAAAVQQAVLDGVKVINFSIGGGTDPLTDPVELAFLDAYAAGVFVAASAGNSGPGPATAGHGGPWVTTVGASTQRREFATTLNLTAPDGSTFDVNGASITSGAGPAPVVLASAAPYNDPTCASPAPPGLFTGKIVACQRSPGRVLKGFNVKQGGAAGMVLYNPTLADVLTDSHYLPTVHVADGTELVAFLTDHPGSTGEFAAGTPRNGRGDVMAAFSSRGPLGSFLKPDITAPGVQVLAADTPIEETVGVSGPAGELFQAIAGTSMAAPHVAGSAILVSAVHPTWSPGQVKSALMTTGVRNVVKEDLTTPADPFDRGGGRVDVGNAINAPLTLDETAARYAALAGDPVHHIDLNVPSIDAPAMPGAVTTTRTVKNVTGGSLAVTMGEQSDGQTSIAFSPRRFTLARGASRTVRITLSSSAPIEEQRFAEVRFATPKGTVRLPVAFLRKQGVVTLTQGCTPESIARTQSSTCTVSATNTSFDSSQVELVSAATPRQLRITGVTGGGAALRNGVVTADATLDGAKPGVPSIAPGATPAGYLPLSAFGIAPQSIGDEQILNFDVPAFRYNGRTYTSVGVDSNGYLVAGGGTAEDNECCNLPAGNSSAPPNEILAPFWTDLDGTGAEGIRLAVLTDGVNDWVVVEWNVNVFGTTSPRTFQVWIGVNGVQDISYTYDPANLPADPNGQPFLVAAENELGQGGALAGLPTADLVVTSTDPVPGDTLTYTMTVRGIRAGTGAVRTAMEATGVPGTTLVDSRIQVTP